MDKLCLVLLMLVCSAVVAQPARNDWYRQALVSIHCDNHSGLFGKGVPYEDLVAAFKDVPVTMIQVSAQSNLYATYPTQVGLNNPDAGGYDTLGTFKKLTQQLGLKLCVYMSVDRRPLQIKDHPEWAQRDARNEIIVNGDTVVCQRPSREKKGYLYERFIPQIQEIVSKYDPAGFWFDGDYILTRPCWCANCLKEWQAETGREAPRDDKAADWAEWNEWHYRGYQEYRRLVAEAIHQASPKALYTSNWSWAWSPEPTPEWIDTLSGDAWSVGQVAKTCMRWGAQQQAPWDIMSYQCPASRALNRTYSAQRTFQEGGITLAHGGRWFGWTFGGDLPPAAVDMTRRMGQFVKDRAAALGPSVSLAQVAVLDPETSWLKAGRPRETMAATAAAQCLMEARYFTDIVNEQTLRAGLTPYRLVVLPGGSELAPETVAWLESFARGGGGVLVCGDGLHGGAKAESETGLKLLGLKRTGRQANGPAALRAGEQRHWVLGSWDVEPAGAKTMLSFEDGRPGLLVNQIGEGKVAYLASDQVLYPEDEAFLAALAALGHGPSYAVNSGGAPVLCTLRQRGREVVLHLVDMSSRVNGRWADVNSADFTDDNPPLRNVRVQLPCSGNVRLVQAVPALTGAKVSVEGGMLTVTLNYLQTHAAVVMAAEPEAKLALHPGAAASSGDYHPLDPATSGFLEAFENIPVGQAPPSPWRAWSKDEAKIAVTDETAASGTRSVCFTEADKSSFWPFMHRSVTPFRQGRARLAFEVRVDGADCLLEVRYEGKGAGPQVWFRADGKLLAGNKELLTFPVGQWIHAQADFTLGGEKPGYSLTVTLPGQQPQVFPDLPYVTEWFFLCDSVYFVGSGEGTGRFWLDNVRFERME